MSTGKNKLPFFCMTLLGILLLIGCGSQPAESPTPGKTELPAASSTPTVVPMKTTAVTPTETATIEPTPTTPPYTRCQEIIDAQMPKDFLTEGSIIFSGECEGKKGLYKLSAETGKIEPFLDGIVDPEKYYSHLASNDSQWLEIENPQYDRNGNFSNTSLIVTGEDDRSTISYPMNRKWGGVADWLKNGFLSIWTVGSPKMNLLDPFTGKISVFSYSKPDDMNLDITWIYFDNALAREVYIGPDLHYQIREILSDRILYTSEARYTAWNIPKWSPSGAYLSFPMQEENSNSFRFIAVDRNGKQRATEETFSAVGNISFSWSPQGTYLSFLTTANQGEKQVVLWNPETNQIIKPAVPILSDFSFPNFSPDEQKFIVQANEDSSENSKMANYIVDLAAGKVTSMDISLRPVAWLKTNRQITKPKSEPYPLSPRGGANIKQVCLKSQVTATAPAFNGGLVFVQKEYLSIYTSNKQIDQLAKTDLALVSPDQRWLFYWYNEPPDYKARFWLYSLNKQPTEVKPGQRIYYEYLNRAVKGWSGNSELWVESDYSNLFDPFENTFRQSPELKEPEFAGCISASCPDSDSSASEFYNIYDSKFERHVFFSGGWYPDGALMMYDKDAKILWDTHRPLIGFNMPKWQPGDQELAIPMPKDEKDELGDHYEIFTIDREGHQRQITDYSVAYPSMTIDKFSWSPDGRYIAFWGDTHSQENIAQQNPYRLFVLDTVTRQTVDYCVTGSYMSRHTENRAPIWSPDGSQIAVNGILDGKRQILLVDFASGTVSPVAEGELIGWMANP